MTTTWNIESKRVPKGEYNIRRAQGQWSALVVYTVDDYGFEKKGAVIGYTGYCIDHSCISF